MVMPTTMPVFVHSDILPPPAEEYEDGDQRTTIGWLKHLFLYYTVPDKPDCMQIRPEDRKDYEKAVDILKRECKIRGSLIEWEDKTTQKKQAGCLNVVRKKLGYVEEYYDS